MTAMKHKVVAITGGASGMGYALAQLLAEHGVSVSIADISQPALDKAVDDLKTVSASDKVLACPVDVRQPQQIATWLEKTIDEFGHLDSAANVAGIINFHSTGVLFEDQTDEYWNWVLGVNLTGLANCIRNELKITKRPGAIVNVASVSGLRGDWGTAAYTASKHGVVGLTKFVARQYGPKGIRVNAVAPGVVDTPMVDAIPNSEESFKKITEALPIQRKGRLEEIAKLMMFLLSDDARFITGATYSIDGGINV